MMVKQTAGFGFFVTIGFRNVSSALADYFQPVPGQRDPCGQFRLRPVVVVVVGQMREKGPARIDAARGGERFIQTHVGGMRLVAQGVQHGNFHAAHDFQGRLGNFLAIAQVRQPLLPVLLE